MNTPPTPTQTEQAAAELPTVVSPAAEAQTAPRNDQPPAISPLLLDFSVTISRLVIIGAGLIIYFLSAAAGAELWMIALRTTSAMLCLGIFFWLFNSILNQNVLEIAYALGIIKRGEANAPMSFDNSSAILRQAQDASGRLRGTEHRFEKQA